MCIGGRYVEVKTEPDTTDYIAKYSRYDKSTPAMSGVYCYRQHADTSI